MSAECERMLVVHSRASLSRTCHRLANFLFLHVTRNAPKTTKMYLKTPQASFVGVDEQSSLVAKASESVDPGTGDAFVSITLAGSLWVFATA